MRYTLRRRPIQRDRGLLRASPACSGRLSAGAPASAARDEAASAEPAHLGSRVVFAAAPPASPRDHGVRTRKSRPSRRFRTAFTRTRGSGRRKRSRVSRRPALAIRGPHGPHRRPGGWRRTYRSPTGSGPEGSSPNETGRVFVQPPTCALAARRRAEARTAFARDLRAQLRCRRFSAERGALSDSLFPPRAGAAPAALSGAGAKIPADSASRISSARSRWCARSPIPSPRAASIRPIS